MKSVLVRPPKFVKALAKKAPPVYNILMKQRDCRITKERSSEWTPLNAGFHAYVPISSFLVEDFSVLSNALVALSDRKGEVNTRNQSEAIRNKQRNRVTIQVLFIEL